MEPIKFGKFLVVDKIATGGMAEIYKARVKTPDGALRTVAIKKILGQYSKNEDFITLLTDEAKLMVTLNHPNIVPVIEFGAVDKDYYLALEYIRGKNLKDLLEKIEKSKLKIPLEVCSFIAREICQGLDYAHRKRGSDNKNLKIIHRDISPTNVLLSYAGEVKIVDFGISKAATHTHVTQTGIIRGKMGYMSPEQTKSYLDIDGRSDIYSAGILLYEMFTGRRLFPAETIQDAIQLVRKGDIPSPTKYRKDLPSQLEQIVMKALKYEVRERIQSAGRMRDMVNEFLAGSAIKKNYAKTFSSQEFSLYMQHIFAKDYEKEIDRMEFDGRDSMSSARIMHEKKFSSSTEGASADFSKSLVTNAEFIQGSTGGHSDKGILWDGSGKITEPRSGDSIGYKKRTVFSPRSILIAALVMLACVIALTELVLKPAIVKAVGKAQTNKNYIETRITTEPTGAELWINGKRVEGKTPLISKFIEGELNFIKAVKKGYASKVFTLKPAKYGNNAVKLKLDKVDAGGSLIVISEPPGAQIYIDEKDTGKVTPTKIEGLTIGQLHTLILQLSGHENLETQFEIHDISSAYLRFNLLKTRN